MNETLKNCNSNYTILFVGGALSAIVLAKQLVEQATDYSFKILIIEKSNHCDGLAYNRYQTPYLTNNNQAKTCSLDPSDDNHFISWATKVGLNYTPDSYPRRYDFGLYIEDTLKEIKITALNKGIKVIYLKQEEVYDLEQTSDGRYIVYSQSIDSHQENQYLANTVVLATGNNRTKCPEFAKKLQDRLIENTLTFSNQRKIQALDVHKNLAIIGSSYSAMDAVMIRFYEYINQRKKNTHGYHKKMGKIFLISRRGLLNYIPSEEPNNSLPYSLSNQIVPTKINEFITSKDLINLLNQEFQLGESLGYSKHQVAVALDKVLIDLLNKLCNDSERHKFIKDYWTVLRAYQNELHEPAAKVFKDLKRKAIVEVLAGHINKLQIDGEDIVINFDENIEPLRVCAIINTAGMDHSYEELVSQNSLLANLEKRGYISPHKKTNLGLAVNKQYEIINSEGFPMPNIHPLGRLVEGEAIYQKFGPYFTGNTGIRGIRNMCAELAPIILQDIVEEKIKVDSSLVGLKLLN